MYTYTGYFCPVHGKIDFLEYPCCPWCIEMGYYGDYQASADTDIESYEGEMI